MPLPTPRICREYSNDFCEFDESADEGFELFFDGYESLLKYVKKRFKSAAKAIAMGYTNVKVFADGFPAWVKAGNVPSVSVEWVKKQVDDKADMVLIDSQIVPDEHGLPDLDASENGVAIQSITLQNEGWERDEDVAEPDPTEL